MEILSYKDFYEEPVKRDAPVSEELTKDCYNVFACRHKFCREWCPDYVEERNESYTSYGVHTSTLALARGNASLPEMKNEFIHCLECGQCELKCPNTMFGGDFYHYATTTVDLVRKMRRDLHAQGIDYDGFDEVQQVIDEHLAHDAGPDEELTSWAAGLDLPFAGETMMFVDYYNAFQTREVPIAAAKTLKAAGVEFGILKHPHVTTGELYETDEDKWVEAAKKNVADLKAAGAKTVILVNPHEYSYFIKEYPRYCGTLPFEVVYITDYVNDLIKADKIAFVKPYNKNVTYHDPCSLNKLCGNYQAPREIIAALPGTHADVEKPILQWKYCCGNGVSGAFRKALPDVAYKIGVRRLRHANDVGAEVLLLACPHCKDMFAETKTKSGINIEPVHILEVVAYCMGIEV